MPLQAAFNESATESTRLESWRQPARRQWLPVRARGLFSLAAITIVCSFIVLAYRPLAISQLTVVSIGASSIDASRSEQSSKPPLADSLTSFQQFAKSQLLANAQPALTLEQFNTDALKGWRGRHHLNHPLFIHLRGDIAVSQENALVVNEPGSSESSESLNLSTLVRQLSGSKSPVIIVLESASESKPAIGDLPEMVSWQFARCLDSEITTSAGSASIAVLTTDKYAHLTARFQNGVDRDHDKTISIGEFLTSVMSDEQSQAQVFSSISLHDWNSIALAPVRSQPRKTKPEPESEPDSAEKRIAVASSEVAGPSHETQHAPIVVDCSAPTLTSATALHQDGIATLHSVDAESVSQTLLSHLSPGAPLSAATTWMSSPSIASLQWEEIRWMRQLTDRDQHWPTLQTLIRCRFIANQLVLNSDVTKWFQQDWNHALDTRLNAERSLASPVHVNNDRYVFDQIQEALRMHESLQVNLSVIQAAVSVQQATRDNLQDLLAADVRADSPLDDIVCQHLQSVLDLTQWLDEADGESIDRGKELLRELDRTEKHLAQTSVSGDNRAQDNSLHHVMGVTRIRVRRSALALRLTNDQLDTAVAQVDAAADAADRVLANPATTNQRISRTIARYTQSMQFVRQQANDPQQEEPNNAAQPRLSKWRQTLASVAQQRQKLSRDATSSELLETAATNEQFRLLAKKLGCDFPALASSPVEIKTALIGSLSESNLTTLRVAITADANSKGAIELEYDSRLIHAVVGERDGENVVAQDIGDPRQTRMRIVPGVNKQASFQLRCVAETIEKTGVNVRWISNDEVFRKSLLVEMPLHPIATLQLDANPQTKAKLWAMHPNRTEYRQLHLKAVSEQATVVNVRLLAWQNTIIPAPPTMTVEHAARWRSRFSHPVEIARVDAVAISTHQTSPIRFAPQKIKPGESTPQIATLFAN